MAADDRWWPLMAADGHSRPLTAAHGHSRPLMAADELTECLPSFHTLFSQVRLEAEKAAEKERLEEEKAVVRIQKAQVRLRWGH